MCVNECVCNVYDRIQFIGEQFDFVRKVVINIAAEINFYRGGKKHRISFELFAYWAHIEMSFLIFSRKRRAARKWAEGQAQRAHKIHIFQVLRIEWQIVEPEHTHTNQNLPYFSTSHKDFNVESDSHLMVEFLDLRRNDYFAANRLHYSLSHTHINFMFRQ